MKYILAVVGLVLCVVSVAANDKQKFEQARIALDRHSDCAAALQLLNSIDKAFRKTPEWLLYSAKANQCAGRDQTAIEYFAQFDSLVPNEPSVAQSISELMYKGKHAWRKNFCIEAQKVAAAWPDNFRAVRTNNTLTTRSKAPSGVQQWNISTDFQRPWFRNAIDWSANQAWIGKDRKDSFFEFEIYMTPAGSGIGEEMFSVVSTELRNCFGRNYEEKTVRLRTIRDGVSLVGKALVLTPRNQGMAPIYLWYRISSPYEWSTEKGLKERVEFIDLTIGTDPVLTEGIVQ